jgi:hypothetical protein
MTKSRTGVLIIGLTRIVGGIELLVGMTMIAGLAPILSGTSSPRPFGFYVFIFTTSFVSLAIGVGLIFLKEKARKYLVYFSGYIVIEKIMIFFGVLSLEGEWMTTLFGVSKEVVSFVYHGLALIIFSRHRVRYYFK